ncbi:MAG: hypothetical protein MUD14_10070 [Hydrococcus sp. Prado102]|jgi:hypothetical protein|nr:hypothetical protein [Hydrococcus sp. Prado102]
MAIIDDLTFQQLAEALPAGSMTFANGTITLDIEKVTGEDYASLNVGGVVKFLYRLRAAAGSAQNTVNGALTGADVPLDAFPEFSFGQTDTLGNVPVSQVTQVYLSINPNKVRGQTA